VNRWTKRLLILAALVAAILVLRFVVLRSAPVPVTVFRVDSGRVEDTVVNSRAGTVESRRRSEMSPGIAGLVAEIPVKKGQAVKQGDVLLRLDDNEYRAQVRLSARSLDAAKAAGERACLSAEQAARELRRAESLAQKELVSDQGLEEAQTLAASTEAECKAAREQIKQADAALAAARAVLAKTVMTAPFDGVVLDVTTEVGEWISPTLPGIFIPPVIDLIDPTDLYVRAPLDEADVASVHLDLPVRITLDAFRGRSFPGALTYAASYVETQQEQNRTLSVEAVFDMEDLPDNLLPGLSADVEVILDAREGAIRIPTYALLEGGEVLVVRGGRLEAVSVETGLRNWEWTEVVSGLSEGDPVVVSLDRQEVRAGVRAEIEEEIER
jgi:HlyD family secretion protein